MSDHELGSHAISAGSKVAPFTDFIERGESPHSAFHGFGIGGFHHLFDTLYEKIPFVAVDPGICVRDRHRPSDQWDWIAHEHSLNQSPRLALEGNSASRYRENDYALVFQACICRKIHPQA